MLQFSPSLSATKSSCSAKFLDVRSTIFLVANNALGFQVSPALFPPPLCTPFHPMPAIATGDPSFTTARSLFPTLEEGTCFLTEGNPRDLFPKCNNIPNFLILCSRGWVFSVFVFFKRYLVFI